MTLPGKRRPALALMAGIVGISGFTKPARADDLDTLAIAAYPGPGKIEMKTNGYTEPGGGTGAGTDTSKDKTWLTLSDSNRFYECQLTGNTARMGTFDRRTNKLLSEHELDSSVLIPLRDALRKDAVTGIMSKETTDAIRNAENATDGCKPSASPLSLNVPNPSYRQLSSAKYRLAGLT